MAKLSNTRLSGDAERLLKENLQEVIEQYISDAKRLSIMSRPEARTSAQRALAHAWKLCEN